MLEGKRQAIFEFVPKQATTEHQTHRLFRARRKHGGIQRMRKLRA